MSATHEISPQFMSDLKKDEGCLSPVLKAVQDDDTLMLGLRGKYISIYYRGGELLKITQSASCYVASFNADYDKGSQELKDRLKNHGEIDVSRYRIRSTDEARLLIRALVELKWIMDKHPKICSGHEREFQQLVVRENNRARSAGASDYFITDMEHAKGKEARFDMIGARWKHNERKMGDKLVPTLFEMKYGEAALNGKAGVEKHLKDIASLLESPDFRTELQENIGAQFSQLDALKLLRFNRSKSIDSFTSAGTRFQIVFILAGLNPRSKALLPILNRVNDSWPGIREKLKESGAEVDLLFFQASFCGYAMHEATMLPVDEIISKLR